MARHDEEPRAKSPITLAAEEEARFRAADSENRRAIPITLGSIENLWAEMEAYAEKA